MGWRERLDVILKNCWEGVGCTDEERDAALLDMPPADRIALARELLEGTGRVVASDPGKRFTTTPVDGYNAGWNAARAAMLGEEGGAT